MYTHPLNCYTEAKARQQEMLRRAEHERSVNKLLRARKQESKSKRLIIPQNE
jgi:hypothetical protein